MMLPPLPDLIIWLPQACVVRKVPVMLMSSRRRNFSWSYVSALMLELWVERQPLSSARWNRWYSLRNAGSVDKDVQLAIVVDNVLDSLAHSLTVAHVDAVEAYVDASLLAKLAGCLVSELLLNVHDGDTAHADLSQRLRHVQTETTTATGCFVSTCSQRPR